MNPSLNETDCAVIGAGIIGIATAYYLKALSPNMSVILIDQNAPMTGTSAQSGENYRNWWPHPLMKTFIEHSVHLMDGIAVKTSNRIHMNRTGYVLATRQNDISSLIEEIESSSNDHSQVIINQITAANSKKYTPANWYDWQHAPDGVDILSDRRLIQKHFPHFDLAIENIIHVRIGGMFDSQQMASFMLENFKQSGGRFMQSKVTRLSRDRKY